MAATAHADSKRDEAKLRFGLGVALFAKGDLARALPEFEASYELNPVPDVLFNIGLTQSRLHRNVDALHSLVRFLHDARERKGGLTAKRQADTDKLVAELKTQVGSLLIAVSPPIATLLVDGQVPQPIETLIYVEPGAHRIDVSAPGFSSLRQELSVAAGTTSSVSVSLSQGQAGTVEVAPPVVQVAPSPIVRTPFVATRRGKATIALATLTAATFIGAGIVGGLALSKRSDYQHSCEPTGICDRSIYDTGHAMAISTDVMLGVGGGLAVATLVVALVKPRAKALAIAPIIGTNNVGLSFAGGF